MTDARISRQKAEANWADLRKRIEQVARGAAKNSDDGVVIVGVKIFMDSRGGPIFWSTPVFTSLEPKNTDWLHIFGYGDLTTDE